MWCSTCFVQNMAEFLSLMQSAFYILKMFKIFKKYVWICNSKCRIMMINIFCMKHTKCCINCENFIPFINSGNNLYKFLLLLLFLFFQTLFIHLKVLTVNQLESKVISLCHQYRARPACTSVQSDQALYCWLANSYLDIPKINNGQFWK